MLALCILGHLVPFQVIFTRNAYWRHYGMCIYSSDLGLKDVELTLTIEGMSCQQCVANVKRALESIEGVDEAKPDLESGLVQLKGTVLDVVRLAKAVQEAGYRVIEDE